MEAKREKMAEGRSNKAAVQATNDDASASKLSCVKKGYMKDDYVHLFVRRPVRRAPIINREGPCLGYADNIERVELFDEFEEWHMMQEHYCVAYAINDALGLFGNFGFPGDK